jgi:hypothetical protein
MKKPFPLALHFRNHSLQAASSRCLTVGAPMVEQGGDRLDDYGIVRLISQVWTIPGQLNPELAMCAEAFIRCS